MDLLMRALCFCVTVTAGPQPQMARAAGDIWYTDEPLGRGARLLRLSTTDFIIDNDAFRERRLHAFAAAFADKACHGRYQLAPSGQRIEVHPSYTKQFVFRCR
jgi:hypothetical protein